MTTTNFINLPVAVPIDGAEWVPITQLQGTQYVTCRTTIDQITGTTPNNVVTNSQLANAPGLTIKSNATNLTGTVGDNSISIVLDAMLSSTQGVVLYRGASSWLALAPGVNGQVLQTHGPNANPGWASTGGVGTVTQITAGAGLSGGVITASGTIASIETVNAQTGTTYALQLSDQAKLVTFNNGSPIAVSIVSAATMGSGWWVDVQDLGAGAATITPTGSTINGASSLAVSSGTGFRIVSDGANYQIRGSGSLSALTLTGDVTGSGTSSIATTVGSIGGQAVSLAGSLTFSGSFSTNFTVSAPTTLVLPVSGTVTALGNSTTGSGSIVLATSPSLTTPSIDAATATSINKVTITTPATGSTLTIADGKTLTSSNTLTFTGTDGSTLNVGTGGTIVTSTVASLPNLATVNTITSGTWNGTVITGTYGGTGVNNGASTLTLGGSLSTSGAFATTFTMTAPTSVTFPTSGTLVNSSVATLSSLSSIGTITTGTWHGSIIGGTWGGTGVNNGSSTLTLGGNLATSGAFASTFTMTGATTVTFPTTGTLAKMQGIIDGSDAASGIIGERIGVTWSAVSLTTTTTSNAASMSLTAGDWDVYLGMEFLPAGATLTAAQAGISNVSLGFLSATTDGFPVAIITNGSGTNGNTLLQVAWRLNITITTTVYAVANATFSSTCSTGGAMWARRAR